MAASTGAPLTFAAGAISGYTAMAAGFAVAAYLATGGRGGHAKSGNRGGVCAIRRGGQDTHDRDEEKGENSHICSLFCYLSANAPLTGQLIGSHYQLCTE